MVKGQVKGRHFENQTEHMELSNLICFSEACWGSRGVLNERGTDENRVSKRNSLTYMTLRDFIASYSEELGDYYGGEFWFHELDIIHDSKVGDTVVFCLVDT